MFHLESRLSREKIHCMAKRFCVSESSSFGTNRESVGDTTRQCAPGQPWQNFVAQLNRPNSQRSAHQSGCVSAGAEQSSRVRWVQNRRKEALEIFRLARTRGQHDSHV